uniref:CMP-sialic acid transporter n=1 Tax=Anas zonorhyncha TaxID=75864 RepID=A0A8B9ZY10_9AVES
MTLVAATYTVALRYTRTVQTELYFSTTAVCITEVIKLFLSVGILLKLLCKQLDIQVCPFCIFSVFICCLTSVSLCCILLWKSLYFLCSSEAQLLLFWQDLFFQGLCVSLWLFIHQRAVCFVLEDCEVTWGVYFEKVLKSSDTSLWVRNIQMYLSGIAVTLFGVYMSDGAQVLEKGFFYGYTHYVWFVIFLASVGGLYTSVVVKYTDNIMKGFSAAAAIVLSTVASVILFGLQLTTTFLVGAILVCISIYFYGFPRQDTTKIQPAETKSPKERLDTV